MLPYHDLYTIQYNAMQCNAMHTSYEILSSGIPWKISLLYDEKGLHNYFIPCHRKYSGQMGRLGVIQLNCTDRWEGSVEY